MPLWSNLHRQYTSEILAGSVKSSIDVPNECTPSVSFVGLPFYNKFASLNIPKRYTVYKDKDIEKIYSLIRSNLNLSIQQDITLWCLPLFPFSFSLSPLQYLVSAIQSSNLNSFSIRKYMTILESLDLNSSLQGKYFLFHCIPGERKRRHKHGHDSHSQGDFIPLENFQTREKFSPVCSISGWGVLCLH